MGDAVEMLFEMFVAAWIYSRALRFAFLIGARQYPRLNGSTEDSRND